MELPLDKLRQIPPSCVSVGDYEELARARMTGDSWAYLAGGAEDEVTLRENAAAFTRLSLKTRVLQDLSGGHTRLQLFGQTFSFPILLAPVAYHRLFHPDGELATAVAASAVQAGMIVSTLASVMLEDIARQATAPLWFQVYIQSDRAFTRELVQRAETAGYQALMLTVDAPVSGLPYRQRRSGFRLPPDIEAVNLRGARNLGTHHAQGGGEILLGSPLLAAAPTWQDVGWLKSLTKLPLIIKGIMTPEDAEQAIAAGVDGIVVSNHGGRTLDMQPASIDVLPEIAAAVQGRVPLLLDSGIRRGSDVFKALALGASAVLIGRPYMYGLAAAGAVGVSHIMQILRAELEVTMALTGCRDLAAINPSLIRR